MRRLRYTALTVALGASGTYLFVYLFRWEWHRALVAGVLFVATEVALAATAILDRLRAIETRLAEAPGTGPSAVDVAGPLRRLQETATQPRTNFDWLTRQDGGMSVFVPLLLGTGVVLSGAAWVVERLARASARPLLERGLAGRLAPFALPVGTLAGADPPLAPLRRSRVAVVAGLAVAAAVVTVGLDVLADASQNRPDKVVDGSASAVVVAVDPGSARSPLAATSTLWAACTTQVGGSFRVVGMSHIGAGQVRLLVTPSVGKYAERRLRGCVNDATTDRINARVRSVTALGELDALDALDDLED